MKGETAAERIHERHQHAEKILWWWRLPYLAILAVVVALLWFRLGGLPGAFVAVGVGAMGVWVATMNPWKLRIE